MGQVRILAFASIVFLIIVSLGSSLEIGASVGNGASDSSTDVKYAAENADSVDHSIKADATDADIHNSYFGTGSLASGSITKSDAAKGISSTAYRSVNGKSGYTSWRYDWGTSTPSSTVGKGVGTWLSLDVSNAYGFSGGSYGSNAEGDYAGTLAEATSPSGVTAASVSNMYTATNAFTNDVYSKLSANMGTGASYIWFDAYANNKEGESTWHWTDAYGTADMPAVIFTPTLEADAKKTSAKSYGKTEGAYGSTALLRTHTENKVKMIGHEGTYYTGGGDFGYQKNNYERLTGSVLGSADKSNVYLTPNVDVASYRTAYLLDPYRYEWVTGHGAKDWGYDAFSALMSRQQAVTYYWNAGVSHSRVGDMDNYYVSVISAHMNPSTIEITRAADADRRITATELTSMFTKNPQGFIMLDGCESFKPSATSSLANAVKNKEYLSAGYDYSVGINSDNLYMSKFFNYLAAGDSARTSQSKASADVYNTLGERTVPIFTPSNHDFYLL